jgi:hypothetical protein
VRGGAWKRAGRGRQAKPVLEQYGRVPEGRIRRRCQASSACADNPHQASRAHASPALTLRFPGEEVEACMRR